MIDFIELNRMIREYLRNPSNKSLFLLEQQMRVYRFPKWKIEKLIDYGSSLPSAHLAAIYLWVDRPLEGSYYLRKHLADNGADLDAWRRLQLVAAERGDLHTSSLCLKKLSRQGTNHLFVRALVIHALARGDLGTAIHNTKWLIAHGERDHLTAVVVYDICLHSGEWIFMKWLSQSSHGRTMLRDHPSRDGNSLRSIAIMRMAQCIQHLSTVKMGEEKT